MNTLTKTQLKSLYKNLNDFMKVFTLEKDTNFVRVKNIVAVKLADLEIKDEQN